MSKAAIVVAAVLVGASLPGGAQSTRQQAERELARSVPAGTLPACSLITRADVTKATGRNPYVDPEPAGQGGWICNVGVGELKVYSGPGGWDAWEATMKRMKKDMEPRTPVTGIGERAYVFYLKAENAYQSDVAFLVTKAGNQTLALSLDAPKGKPPETMRPALESLMRTIVARLP